MDISSYDFPSGVLSIIKEISECHFVAIDCEFSGIAGRRPRGTGKLTLQQYYQETREAAQQYQVLQIGLAVVKEDVNNQRYIIRPYNFNISPLPALREKAFSRTWSCSSGGKLIPFLIKDSSN